MNLPTKITVLRIFLAPLFFIVFFIPEWTGSFAAGSIYILMPLLFIMELSDALDGYIARRQNMVTDIGKILDPFADIISRVTCFICFAFIGIMPLWAFLIIMYREFGITFARMLMVGRGVTMAASIWGKAKAITYTVSCSLGLVLLAVYRLELSFRGLRFFEMLVYLLFVFSAIASVLSFLTYIIQIHQTLKADKA